MLRGERIFFDMLSYLIIRTYEDSDDESMKILVSMFRQNKGIIAVTIFNTDMHAEVPTMTSSSPPVSHPPHQKNVQNVMDTVYYVSLYLIPHHSCIFELDNVVGNTEEKVCP